MTTDVKDVVRVKCEVDGQNCYVLVGEDSCMAKLPFENRPENERLRNAVDAVCEAVEKGLRLIREK